MNITDIVFVLFVGLLIVIGVVKGFVRTVIDLISGFVAFVAALILSRPIAHLLADMTYFDPAKQRISDFFNDRASGAADTVTKAVNGLSVPEFISEYILKDIPDSSTLLSDGVQYVSSAFFTLMLTAIVFVVILIIIRMLFFFLAKSFESLFKKVKVLRTTDKLLGALLGALNALFITLIILSVVAMAASKFPKFIDSISDSLIVSRLYNDNLLLRLLSR
ncbi:MAG: CvpA family protein [Eubacteriales bacterium]|jgi:uncharacterized membrane protein required for colicin V production|nr:CvpA family protein [Eubacteriales bacterium]MDD4327729.1 CvpA family protein [Eubacteriales bacterium]MDD4716925.1 CvpA family protein [Eubacteriales bacterium]